MILTGIFAGSTIQTQVHDDDGAHNAQAQHTGRASLTSLRPRSNAQAEVKHDDGDMDTSILVRDGNNRMIMNHEAPRI